MQYSLKITQIVFFFFSPAEVAAIQPVIFDLFIGGHVTTIEVVVALILEPLWSCRALPWNWGGEQFAFAGLLACLTLS